MPLIIILIIYVSVIFLNAWLAGKAQKDRAFALAISFFLPIPALFVYAFMFDEFKRKNKQGLKNK